MAVFLTGLKKAAVFLLNIDKEFTSEIMKHLDTDEIKNVTTEMAKMGAIDEETAEIVNEEFLEQSKNRFIASGGIEYIEEMLNPILGSDRASNILNSVKTELQKSGFSSLKTSNPGQLARLIEEEHPQTIALILSHMEDEQAAVLLDRMSEEIQAEIIRRVATIDEVSPDTIRDIEVTLEGKLSKVTGGTQTMGGPRTVAQILNKVSRSTERNIMKVLERDEPELSEKIKELMFLFEDIVKLDNMAVMRILKEVNTNDVALAMKVSSEEVKQKFFDNMSRRAAEMIKEELEYMGPVKLSVVEEAQKRIVDAIRKLADSGDIVIGEGSGGETFV